MIKWIFNKNLEIWYSEKFYIKQLYLLIVNQVKSPEPNKKKKFLFVLRTIYIRRYTFSVVIRTQKSI